jgi:hypothetical protein
VSAILGRSASLTRIDTTVSEGVAGVVAFVGGGTEMHAVSTLPELPLGRAEPEA